MIAVAWQAQLHREVYIATLNSVLREPSSKRRFAEQIGITPQYLSYLLDPYNIRTPSPSLAQKIAAALPIPLEQRQSLLEHMLLAHERRLQLATVQPSYMGREHLLELLALLRTAHQAATFTPDAAVAKAQYKLVRTVGIRLLEHADPKVAPFEYLELCFLLHDAECVLNRPDEALYHAKLAYNVVANLEPGDYHREREGLEDFLINAIRAEAVAYHNLKLFHKAYDCCLQAEITEAMKQKPWFWKPHLYRDKINALIGKPRFPISEAEGLANQVKVICNRRADEFDPLLELLINRSLGQAYIQYGNLKKARRLLKTLVEQLETTPHVGPLHKCLALRTYARLLWAEKALSDWKFFVGSAIDTAVGAGLYHQIHEIGQEYGFAAIATGLGDSWQPNNSLQPTAPLGRFAPSLRGG